MFLKRQDMTASLPLSHVTFCKGSPDWTKGKVDNAEYVMHKPPLPALKFLFQVMKTTTCDWDLKVQMRTGGTIGKSL